MREKLIELLDDIQRFGAGYTDFELYGMRLPDEVFNDEVADHLIANGVTIPVRCKDCKHHEHYDALLYCGHIRGLTGSVSPHGYCVYAERKTDDGESS